MLAMKHQQLLIQHWRNGSTLEAIPSPLRPATRADGYLIRVSDREAEHPAAVWVEDRCHQPVPVSSTSRVDGPLGRATPVGDGPSRRATIAIGANRMRVAEAEFAFRMKCDLTAACRSL